MSSFRIVPLAYEPFSSLFALDDSTLAQRHIARVYAGSDVGWPCRVSLRDATRGEELLLLTYQHQPADSPYRSSGPIYVRRGATSPEIAAGELPAYVTRRLISMRAYDAHDMMIAAEVCEGVHAATEITRAFSDSDVRYIHLHNAKPGCFSCRVDRVDPASGDDA